VIGSPGEMALTRGSQLGSENGLALRSETISPVNSPSSSDRMLRVAIVGCGKIADSHASQIQRIKGCKIVAVCDREELMAKQLAERAGVEKYFSELSQLLEKTRPDVIHITTPPQSHFELGRQCLDYGCHVYIEKPFAVTTEETSSLIRLAEERHLKITAGHDDQFRHAARRMRQLVSDGYLGGPVIHMESYYCYELGETSDYAKALLADKNHWVRQLPGRLLHNIISHGIARIAEFLTTDTPQVIALAFISPTLRKMGETEIFDELRVIIAEEERVTAYFTFSSQMRPALHQFRVYGAKNGLVLDQDNETLIKLPGRRYKSYLEQFVPPFIFAEQYLGNVTRNIRTFVAGDFHMKSGMKYLIESFYASIAENKPPPIPYREILLTSRIMDTIFEQIGMQHSANRFQGSCPPAGTAKAV
jgi:predicted dehydrogenase